MTSFFKLAKLNTTSVCNEGTKTHEDKGCVLTCTNAPGAAKTSFNHEKYYYVTRRLNWRSTPCSSLHALTCASGPLTLLMRLKPIVVC